MSADLIKLAVGMSIGQLVNSRNRKATRSVLNQKKAITESRNKAMIVESSRQVSEFNRQRSIASLQTTEALAHYKRKASAEKGKLKAAIAASDTIGSAALFAIADVERTNAEAKAMALYNLGTTQDNINSMATSMLNNTLSQYQGFEFLESTWNDVAGKEKQAFIETAMSFANSKMGQSLMDKGFDALTKSIPSATAPTFSTGSFTKGFKGLFGATESFNTSPSALGTNTLGFDFTVR
jgi:hypothetical protein